MSEEIMIEAPVRMRRRPHFKGLVKAIQLPIIPGGGGVFCKWDFKPEEWVSGTALNAEELEVIEKPCKQTRTNH